MTYESNEPTCEHYCVFRVSDSWFGMLATSIREVIACPPLTDVPNASTILVGVCHFRNEFIPAIDVFESSDSDQRRQMMIISTPTGTWGWLVDEVAGLSTLEMSICANANRENSLTAAVMGHAAYGDKIVRVLDVNAVFRVVETQLKTHWERVFSPEAASEVLV